jgi:N4-gp56 family major capsid protein
MTTISTGAPSYDPPITTSLWADYLLTPTPDSIAQAQIMRVTIDAGQGTTKRFVQIPLFPIFPNSIPNNTSGPSPIAPSYYNRDVILALYSQCTILDVTAVITSQIEWVQKTLMSQEISMVRTEDFICATTLSASGNTLYCQGGTNGDSPTNLSVIDANNVTGTLMNANAPRTTANIPGTNKFGTNPLASGYTLLTSTASISTFLNDSNFEQVSQYSQPMVGLPGEIGKYGTLRVLTSTDWPIFASGLSLNGNPIIQGSVTSVQAYVIVMHSSMYHQISAVGAAFYGSNMLQVGTSAQNYIGTSIVQPEWVINMLYTAI